MAVDTVALKRDPVGPEVAFLEDVNANPKRAQEFDRGPVQRPAIAVENEIADPPFCRQRAEPAWPCLRAPAEQDCLAPRPVEEIAAVEGDAGDVMALLGERAAERVKERAVRPLQEQEALLHRDYRALAVLKGRPSDAVSWRARASNAQAERERRCWPRRSMTVSTRQGRPVTGST